MSVQQVEITVSTTSQQIPSGNQPPELPKITIAGNEVPPPSSKPYTASGWQVVVLNAASDLTKQEAILSNLYTPIPEDGSDWGNWEAAYEQMVQQFLTSGNPLQQIVIVSTYGLDLNLPPTNSLLEQLFNYGGGVQAQEWVINALDSGSEGADWTGIPFNYILIGASGLSYNGGTEASDVSSSAPITTTATAQFANIGAFADLVERA